MTSATPVNQASPPHQQQQMAASPPTKRDLKSWWKGFKMASKSQEPQETKAPGIFGVPLRQSITYANVAISLIDESGQSYIYGYVPIVVAKCGVFLKEKATSVEGIFRLSGSEKRIKELKVIFDSPDRYGKGLVWDGYTVHDASNVLRRYLNDLPEPVVPLDLYEKFRDPLRGATKQPVEDAEGPQFVHDFDEKRAIEKYQQLITELPPLNRQLLLYILDLLAVFAAKSDENRMTSQNLAAIFQPGMLSHPSHAMAPEEYRLNQCVIIFLIENQDHFLIGMQGTAADEKTVQEVESGTPQGPLTPAVGVNQSGLDRSASTASAGAESVRKDGKLRRNRSVNSRHSKEGSNTPTTPAVATTPTGGLGRSNTVPSKKSPAIGGGNFKDLSPAVQPLTPARIGGLTTSEQSSPTPATDADTTHDSGRSRERLLENSPDAPVARERNISNLFQRSGTDVSEKRQPNKLRKKKIPGAVNISAHSSNTSLPHPHSNAASPSNEAANPMETTQPLAAAVQPTTENKPSESARDTTQEATTQEPQAAGNSLHPDDIKGNKSPQTSAHSSYNGASDGDQGDDQAGASGSPDKEKKKRWRLSRPKKDDSSESHQDSTPPLLNLGANRNAENSTTSFSSAGKPRRSFQAEGSDNAGGDSQDGKDKDDPKGPLGWIKSKYREAKENAEQRRNKSPSSPERQGAGSFLGRGKSLDIRRDQSEPKTEQDPKAEQPTDVEKPTEATVATTEAPNEVPPKAEPEQALGTSIMKEEPARESAVAETQPPQTQAEAPKAEEATSSDAPPTIQEAQPTTSQEPSAQAQADPKPIETAKE